MPPKIDTSTTETEQVAQSIKNKMASKEMSFLSDRCSHFLSAALEKNIHHFRPDVAQVIDRELDSALNSIRQNQCPNPLQFDIHLSQNIFGALKEQVTETNSDASREILSCFGNYSSEALCDYKTQVQNLRILTEGARCFDKPYIENLRQIEQTAMSADREIGDILSQLANASHVNLCGKFDGPKNALDNLAKKTAALAIDPNQRQKLQKTSEELFKKARRNLSHYYEQNQKIREFDNALEFLQRQPQTDDTRLQITVISKNICALKRELKCQHIDQHMAQAQNVCALIETIASIGLSFRPDLRKQITQGVHVVQGISAATSIVRSILTVAVEGLTLGPCVAIFSAAGSIVSLCMGSKSAEEMLQDTIQQVAEQINTLSEMMLQGFATTYQLMNELDNRAQERFRQLAAGLNTLGSQLGRVQQGIDAIQEELHQTTQELTEQIKIFQQETQIQLDELSNQDYLLTKRSAYLFARDIDIHGENALIKIDDLFCRFCSRALDASPNENFAGSQDIEIARLINRLKTYGIDRNINFLFHYAFSHLQPSLPPSLQNPHIRLANPSVWIDAVTSMTDFAVRATAFTLLPAKKEMIEAIIDEGKDVQTFIITLKTNRSLFHSLFCQYRDHLRTVESEITRLTNAIMPLGEIPSERLSLIQNIATQAATATSPLRQALDRLEETHAILGAFVSFAFKDDIDLQLFIQEQLWNRSSFDRHLEQYQLQEGSVQSLIQAQLEETAVIHTLIISKIAIFSEHMEMGIRSIPSFQLLDTTIKNLENFKLVFYFKQAASSQYHAAYDEETAFAGYTEQPDITMQPESENQSLVRRAAGLFFRTREHDSQASYSYQP